MVTRVLQGSLPLTFLWATVRYGTLRYGTGETPATVLLPVFSMLGLWLSRFPTPYSGPTSVSLPLRLTHKLLRTLHIKWHSGIPYITASSL